MNSGLSTTVPVIQKPSCAERKQTVHKVILGSVAEHKTQNVSTGWNLHIEDQRTFNYIKDCNTRDAVLEFL